jgi:hypothetical protein
MLSCRRPPMNRQPCRCNPPPHRSLSALRERSVCFSLGKKNLPYSASWISLRRHCKRRSNSPMRFDRVSSCFDTLKAQSSIARLVREGWFDPRITTKPASLFLNTGLHRFFRLPSLQPASPSDVPRLGTRVIARTRSRYVAPFGGLSKGVRYAPNDVHAFSRERRDSQAGPQNSLCSI